MASEAAGARSGSEASGSSGSAGTDSGAGGIGVVGGGDSRSGAGGTGSETGGAGNGGVAGGEAGAGNGAVAGSEMGGSGGDAGECASACVPITVTQLAVGISHMCALFSDGSIKCWGNNLYGQLGNGNTADIGTNQLPSANPPLRLTTTPGVTAKKIAAGWDHTCALLSDGSVKCWGRNFQGQLGLGNVDPVSSTTPVSALPPVSITTLPGVTAVELAANYLHTCVVLSDGSAKCWGDGALGRLGSGNSRDIGDDELPSAVPPISITTTAGVRAVQLSCSYGGSCALLSDASIKCWGSNSVGQLGIGTRDSIGDDEPPSAGPFVRLPPGDKPLGLSSGDFFTCVSLSNGNARCWGGNELGQLGQGNTETIGDNELPAAIGAVRVATTPNVSVAAVANGGRHACALLSDGTVKCWGLNLEGELGYGVDTLEIGDDESIADLAPYRVTTTPGVTAIGIAAGGDNTCALLSDGSAKCWGNNRYGQLGQGNTENIGDDELPSALDSIVFF